MTRTPSRRTRRDRRTPLRPGVTLVELIVALAIFSVILTTSLAFYDRQGDAFTEGNDRMEVMQNLRYAVNDLEQSIRTAGVGVPSRQPVLVYADENVLAFNADYATNRANDFFAVFYDPRLPDDAVSAVGPARSFTIPLTAFSYPDSSYFLGSGNSPAETITFFFEPDPSTGDPDDYVLYRQVNDRAPEVVARRLLRTDQPFFTYYRVVGGSTPVQALSPSELPAAHTAPTHGGLDDTGTVALVDSIRAVRATYGATGLTGTKGETRTITRLIRIPNAGLATQPTCGNRPLLSSGFTATGVDGTPSDDGYIRLQWAQAIDEYSGEQDVLRYVIWRRVGSSGAWGDPLVSLAPGSSTYLYEDRSADPDVAYSYALAAQDCTPQYSELVTTGEVSWTEW